MPWYSPYSRSDWTIGKGVSELFQSEVRAVRSKHQDLQKTATLGVEEGQGAMHEVSTRFGTFYYQLVKFEWNKTVVHDDRLSPLFSFEVKIYKKVETQTDSWWDRLWRWITRQQSDNLSPYRPHLHETILMRFPSYYPSAPPLMKIENPRYLAGIADMHGNHIFRDGTLCVMSNSEDWDESRSTVVTAFLVGIEWLVGYKVGFKKGAN